MILCLPTPLSLAAARRLPRYFSSLLFFPTALLYVRLDLGFLACVWNARFLCVFVFD